MDRTPCLAAMTVIRSIRKGSVTGMAAEAKITRASTLATAGRTKALRRGAMVSTVPSDPDRVIVTQSPTSGDWPVFRNSPLARQVMRPSAVWT